MLPRKESPSDKVPGIVLAMLITSIFIYLSLLFVGVIPN